MNATMKRFSPARLRQARGDNSLEAVAAACGRTRQTVQNWENGKGEPDASDLSAIASFTKRSLDFFFERVA